MVEGLVGITSTGETLRVREVWSENLDAEFELIRNVVEEFPYIAMDTEFPGAWAMLVQFISKGTAARCLPFFGCWGSGKPTCLRVCSARFASIEGQLKINDTTEPRPQQRLQLGRLR